MHTLKLLLALAFAVAGWPAELSAEPVDFDRDIRPLLSENCFPCHGPDAEAREAGLRLDMKESALGEEGDYAPFVPGEPDQSEAIRRVFSDGPGEQMPPPDSNLSLTDRDKELLRRWVVEGAAWENHWAYVAPQLPSLPAVGQPRWCRSGVDRFVLSRLDKERVAVRSANEGSSAEQVATTGLRPSREADRVTLLRRATLDLTGLPPTTDQVDAFQGDSSPDAYERVVDRLLASPGYGERMAWNWLEASRYADTDGFQGDPTRTMWPWRDWLIGALNRNMPFDEFTIKMLAGDLLPDATQESIIATGFNRNHSYNGEGGRIAEETRVENVFDRTETTSTVWLGLTMTCARCHDHKYDPISQKEYYQLYAFFNNTSESGRRGGGKAPPVLRYLPLDKQQAVDETSAEIARLQKQLNAPSEEADRAQAAWEAEMKGKIAGAVKAESVSMSEWSSLGPFSAEESADAFDQDFGPEQKGVDLSRTRHGGELAWQTQESFVDGKVHALSDTVGATYLHRTIESPSPREIVVSLGSDDGIKFWHNGKLVLAKNVQRAAAPDQEEVRLTLTQGANELLMKIANTGGPAGFYFKKKSESIAGLSPDIAAIIRLPASKRNAKQQADLRRYYRERHWPLWKEIRGRLTKLETRKKQLQGAAANVMVMDHLPPDQRRQTFVLSRGTYNKPLDVEASEGTPSFLPGLPAEAPRDRLTLARWLVDEDNPLTARVTINRYWQLFFGRGFTTTAEDFGRQGERPTHPKLLDWMSRRFIEDWDVKSMHRMIVCSATYRQSSKATDASVSYEMDPDNRLLGRGPRHRLPSWMLRDQALAMAGLLHRKIGGPSIKPYQPEGVWAEATFGKIQYQRDSGAALYRRSLYIFWRRIVGPTMLFDGAKRQTCEVNPTRTNTPLHALTTLNETSFVEAARAMAQRAIQSNAATDEQRLELAFRWAAARSPDSEEVAVLRERLHALIEDFTAHKDAAEELLSVGQSPRDEGIDAAKHAAWTVVCSLLLNLDEVLTKE